MRDPAIRVVLLPRDTNERGTIFGGIILSHLDLAGAVEAAKQTSHRMVTVAMKEVVFKEPVFTGDVLSFYTRTRRVGTSSVTVFVDVEAVGRRMNRKPRKVTEAEVVYVAVDEAGKPVPLSYVPQGPKGKAPRGGRSA